MNIAGRVIEVPRRAKSRSPEGRAIRLIYMQTIGRTDSLPSTNTACSKLISEISHFSTSTILRVVRYQ
jgi:hypothetical protein